MFPVLMRPAGRNAESIINYIKMKRFKQAQAEILHSLLKQVKRQIKNVNSGGCGIFAFYLSGFLAQKGYPCQIICLDMQLNRYHSEYESNRLAIANRDQKSSFVYDHFGIKLGDFFIDANFLIKTKDLPSAYNYFKPLGTMSRNDLKFLISFEDKWHQSYDRSQNQLMKRLLYAVVSKFSHKIKSL